MKFSAIFIFGLLTISAFAAVEPANKSIQVGQQIFYTFQNVYSGTVMGTNAQAGLVTVRLTNFPSLYNVQKETLTFAEGCSGAFCVGDRVAHIGFGVALGTVVGTNAVTDKITLCFDSMSNFFTYDSANLTRSVLQEEKVRVFHANYRPSGGTVIAANPKTKKVTVQFDNMPNLNTYNRDDLTYARGCVAKICVGDRVKQVQNPQLDAVVAGVNLATKNVTVEFTQFRQFYTYPADSLSVVAPVNGIPANDPRRQ